LPGVENARENGDFCRLKRCARKPPIVR